MGKIDNIKKQINLKINTLRDIMQEEHNQLKIMIMDFKIKGLEDALEIIEKVEVQNEKL